jgi:hypothetical protein
MLVKQQQLSFFFILVSHIKLVKYTMVLQQWTGWLRSKKEVLITSAATTCSWIWTEALFETLNFIDTQDTLILL